MKNSNFSSVLTRRMVFLPLLMCSLLFTTCEKENDYNSNTTPERISYQFGLVPTPSSVYLNIPNASAPTPKGSLPSSFFLEIPFTPFDQGQLGSCSSCASSMAKSVLDHEKYNTPFPNNGITYSPSFLYNQSKIDPNDCKSGSYVYTNLDVLKIQGICNLSEMPYSLSGCSSQPTNTQKNLAASHKIDHYFKIDPISISWIKEYIHAGLPVIISFQVDDFFMKATANSIWKQFGLISKGNHCTILYGYDDSKNAFKMLNSWGTVWGNNGTIWVDYNFVQNGSSLFYGKIFYEAYIIQNPAVINNKPTADFDVNGGNTTITAGSSISFVDQSSNNPTSWSWSFSGGTPSSSTLKNPTVKYSNPGNFTVSLTVSNQSGSNTKTITNYIQVNQAGQAPVAQFAASGNTTITAGASVSFVDQSSNNPTLLSWSFPGGTPGSSNLKNPIVIYSTPGVFSVTLTASNQSGSNAKTLTNYIQVNQAILTPVAQFEASSSTTITAGASVSFVDQSSNNPTSWSWSFPGGTPSTSTSKNPTIIYNNPGTYNVSLTVSNQSGSDSKTLQTYILVNQSVQIPVAQFTTSSSTTITAGSSVSFVDQSSNNPTSWSWSFPGGTPSTSTSKNPTIIYNNPGTYNVSLTVSNQSGSDSKTLQTYILVNQSVQIPVAQFEASSSTTITAGSSVSFVDQSTNNPTSWSWSFPGGTPSASTLKNPTITYSNPGNYSVTLTARNQSGSNTKTITNYIQVNQAVQTPVAQFATSDNTMITSGSSVSFVDQSLNNPTSWSWSFPGGTPSTSTLKNPTITYSNPGNYSVTLTARNQNGSDTKTLSAYITVTLNQTWTCGQPFTDPRDGNTYATVSIGGQCWMAENLKYTNNGSVGVNYNNSSSNYNTYGRLYSFNEVLNSNIAPTGWHVPSYSEMITLNHYVFSTYTNYGGAMKSTINLWTPPNTSANNSTGFTGLPSGSLYKGTFSDLGFVFYLWTKTPQGNEGGEAFFLRFDAKGFGGGFFVGDYYFAVRCIKD